METIVVFKGMDTSPAVEARVKEKAAKLVRFYDRIVECRVAIEAPHRHGHQGKIFHVNIALEVPGGEVVVNRNPEQNHAHEDVYVAIRDAFNAAGRKLEDFARWQDAHRSKSHAPRRQGVVARIFPDEGYGFISDNGDELFFHRDSVTTPWDSLQAGTKVHFAVHEGEKGPYASAVTPA